MGRIVGRIEEAFATVLRSDGTVFKDVSIPPEQVSITARPIEGGEGPTVSARPSSEAAMEYDVPVVGSKGARIVNLNWVPGQSFESFLPSGHQLEGVELTIIPADVVGLFGKEFDLTGDRTATQDFGLLHAVVRTTVPPRPTLSGGMVVLKDTNASTTIEIDGQGSQVRAAHGISILAGNGDSRLDVNPTKASLFGSGAATVSSGSATIEASNAEALIRALKGVTLQSGSSQFRLDQTGIHSVGNLNLGGINRPASVEAPQGLSLRSGAPIEVHSDVRLDITTGASKLEVGGEGATVAASMGVKLQSGPNALRVDPSGTHCEGNVELRGPGTSKPTLFAPSGLSVQSSAGLDLMVPAGSFIGIRRDKIELLGANGKAVLSAPQGLEVEIPGGQRVDVAELIIQNRVLQEEVAALEETLREVQARVRSGKVIAPPGNNRVFVRDVPTTPESVVLAAVQADSTDVAVVGVDSEIDMKGLTVRLSKVPDQELTIGWLVMG